MEIRDVYNLQGGTRGIGLEIGGRTYTESLKHQGLLALAEWTAETNKPAITGIGGGYLGIFNKEI